MEDNVDALRLWRRGFIMVPCGLSIVHNLSMRSIHPSAGC